MARRPVAGAARLGSVRLFVDVTGRYRTRLLVVRLARSRFTEMSELLFDVVTLLVGIRIGIWWRDRRPVVKPDVGLTGALQRTLARWSDDSTLGGERAGGGGEATSGGVRGYRDLQDAKMEQLADHGNGPLRGGGGSAWAA